MFVAVKTYDSRTWQTATHAVTAPGVAPFSAVCLQQPEINGLALAGSGSTLFATESSTRAIYEIELPEA